MGKYSCFVLAAFACSLGIAAARPRGMQDKPASADAPIPPADAAKPNPVKRTPEGLAAAKKIYGYDCAMCHGKDGDGQGDLASDMKLTLHDWRDPESIAKMTDGELFYIITNGRGKMTGTGSDRMTEQMRWNMVNLVRSFGKKSGESTAKP